jgi:hypothetical protein
MKRKKLSYQEWSNGWMSGFGISNPEIQDLFYIYISGKYPSIPNVVNRDIYKSVVTMTHSFLKVLNTDLVESKK